jgi:L-fuconolactonase
MAIVDTHVHSSPHWFEPVESLLYHMNANNVAKAALIQFEGQEDNSYLFDCVRRHPGRFAPMVYIDHERPDAVQKLRDLVKQGAEGIRLKPSVRSPDKDALALWRCCDELNLVVSCQGKPRDFGSDEFHKLVQALPQASFVIEHYGHIDGTEQPPYKNLNRILALAKFPNAYVKVGGLSEICERPYPFREPFYSLHGIPPFPKMYYDAFGARRMMWASNYPSVSRNEGYGNAIRYLTEHLSAFCSAEDREWIMGKTALSLFRFR